MAEPFINLTKISFSKLVRDINWKKNKTEIHVHHTWKPDHSMYKGLHSIKGMFNYHTESNGWSDIAQHVSIGPEGSIWTGRPWNKSPASATGYNGCHVFMIETIGDFDIDKDPLEGAQLDALCHVIATLQIRFSLPVNESIKLHNEMTNSKTCPGTSIDRLQFISKVEKKIRDIQNPSIEATSQKIDFEEINLQELILSNEQNDPDNYSEDEGELDHSEQLLDFMKSNHMNPLINTDSDILEIKGTSNNFLNKKLSDDLSQLNELNEEQLFIEIGKQISSMDAKLITNSESTIQIESLGKDYNHYFGALGKRIFKRLEKEIYSLTCGTQGDDASDRAKIRKSFDLGDEAITATIVSVLTTSFGLTAVIASLVAVLFLKRVIKPVYEETCKFWGERIDLSVL